LLIYGRLQWRKIVIIVRHHEKKEEKMKKMKFESIVKSLLFAFITIGLVLIICGFHKGAWAAELVIQSWGGRDYEAKKHAFYDPFTEETGVKIVPVEAAGDLWGKVASQVKSGNVEWDIVNGYDYATVLSVANKGLLEEIDYAAVTDTADLIPGSKQKWGLGIEINVFIQTYLSEVFPGENHPKSWADFYDPKKFPGPRAIHNWGATVFNFASALLADGVPSDKLFPIDYDRSFKVLDRIKPHVKIWYTSGDQFMHALIDKEVVLAHGTDARTITAKTLGASTIIIWNQGLPAITYWNVVKGCPNKKAAMQFLNFICRPEQQAIYTNWMGAACTNSKSIRYLPPDSQEYSPLHPDNLKNQINLYTDTSTSWIVDHLDEMNEKWNEWLSK
jgi:putative spermidine/putrescine transport system substrate-binding protein